MKKQEGNNYCQISPEILKKWEINNYDEISEIYDEVMGEDIANIIFTKYWKILQRKYKSFQNIKILDIACGTGSFLRKLSKSTNGKANLYGIDFSSGQIKKAKSLAREEKVNITFKVDDVVFTEFPQDCDVISMNLDAMNHLKKPEYWGILYTKVYEALKPRGIFLFDINTQKRLKHDLNFPEIIIKPNLTYVQCGLKVGEIEDFVLQQHLMQIFYKLSNAKIKEYYAHIQHIAPTEKRLKQMLKSAGFKNIEEINFTSKERSSHIFMKNRIFIKVEK